MADQIPIPNFADSLLTDANATCNDINVNLWVMDHPEEGMKMSAEECEQRAADEGKGPPEVEKNHKSSPPEPQGTVAIGGIIGVVIYPLEPRRRDKK